MSRQSHKKHIKPVKAEYTVVDGVWVEKGKKQPTTPKEVVADAPEVVADAPKVVVDAPEVVADAPKVVVDASEVVADAPKVVADAFSTERLLKKSNNGTSTPPAEPVEEEKDVDATLHLDSSVPPAPSSNKSSPHNYSFLLKCLAGAAVFGSAVLMVVGLATANLALIGAGIAVMAAVVAGGFFARRHNPVCNFFARKKDPEVEQAAAPAVPAA